MGIPNYAPSLESELTKPFYDGLEQGELRITANARTGEWIWYPAEVTPGDSEAELVWKPVSPDGVVYTFTTVVRSLLPGDHSAETPFTVILFESDDAPGARIPGLLINEGDREPQCGMRVRFQALKVGDHYIAAFEPID